MELHVDIDEADVGQVHEGQQRDLHGRRVPGRTFAATIMQVRFARETVDGVVTYKAVLQVANRRPVCFGRA